MTYCTKQNLLDRGWESDLLARTDKTFSGAINDTILNQAISDAQATIDGYLASRYALPIATSVDLLTRIACDLVHFYLFDDAEPTEIIEKRYDVAIRQLEQIAKGNIELAITPPVATVSHNEAVMVSSRNVFSRSASC
jgi:phage gp36-like protein